MNITPCPTKDITHKMAMVIGVASVITQESHRVPLCNMFRVLLHVSLHTVPKSRDGLHVLVQAKYEAVFLATIGHEFEGIVVDVAVKLNAWFDSPIPLKLVH